MVNGMPTKMEITASYPLKREDTDSTIDGNPVNTILMTVVTKDLNHSVTQDTMQNNETVSATGFGTLLINTMNTMYEKVTIGRYLRFSAGRPLKVKNSKFTG